MKILTYLKESAGPDDPALAVPPPKITPPTSKPDAPAAPSVAATSQPVAPAPELKTRKDELQEEQKKLNNYLSELEKDKKNEYERRAEAEKALNADNEWLKMLGTILKIVTDLKDWIKEQKGTSYDHFKVEAEAKLKEMNDEIKRIEKSNPGASTSAQGASAAAATPAGGQNPGATATAGAGGLGTGPAAAALGAGAQPPAAVPAPGATGTTPQVTPTTGGG